MFDYQDCIYIFVEYQSSFCKIKFAENLVGRFELMLWIWKIQPIQVITPHQNPRQCTIHFYLLRLGHKQCFLLDVTTN